MVNVVAFAILLFCVALSVITFALTAGDGGVPADTGRLDGLPLGDD